MPWSHAVLSAAVVASPVAAQMPQLPPGSQPCHVATVATADLEAAMRSVVRPVWRTPPPLRRWAALIPSQLSVGVHGGTRAGVGWTETLTGLNERWLQAAEQTVTVRLEWDLRDLGRTQPLAVLAETPLEVASRAEQLAQRAAESLRMLRRAEAAAAWSWQGEPLCRDAQADAESAAIVLRALIAAARAIADGASPVVASGPRTDVESR
jgi:hypothetical protein